ncbi:MAG: glucosamine-6-phosphate deaminase [Pedobacter sp.]|nr:MAG: glucosamine-6-phosphate deaminase [Pedobacter sp.]
MSRLNLLQETRFEKLPVTIFADEASAAVSVAKEIADLIRKNDDLGKPTILGLATGSSPIKVYQELIRQHQQENLSFENVICFNLDEYYPMKSNATQSYVEFMNKNLFDHINIGRANIHIPDGMLPEKDVVAFCLAYEQKISSYGGLDLQLLGIGRTGHIGFNEPGSAPNSGTRLVTLDDLTRRDASRDFGGKENVPTKAITMGVGTIFKAKKIILLAWHKKKAGIIKKAVEGEISSNLPATYLQVAENVEFILDNDAASELTRFDTPWLVRDCTWDIGLIKKAVIWLAKKTGKPILKLTEDDYNNNGMAQLATEKGPVYNLNIEIFNNLQHTITGWPGGKPNSSDLQRPERREPSLKRSIVFSPHPDDDVISMGGTFMRLADQGHEVHVAYQTSGNTAVWDDDALRFLEFSIDFNKSQQIDVTKLKHTYQEISAFLKIKQPNQTDIRELLSIKGLIRKGEAIAGARFTGIPDPRIHFMDLPFYDRFKFNSFSDFEDDILKTMDLLRAVKPHQVFTAGDFEDPHGTHKICFNIIINALQRLKLTDDWVKDCWVWLYRGAWHEFETHEIEMAVPLSPAEVKRKRLAIFKHQSQKDTPVFPGDDAREFWVRAEERTAETANSYNQLGLAEYAAIEAFKRYHF